MSEVFCNKCGYTGQADEHGVHIRPHDGHPCAYTGRLTRTAANVEAGPVAWLYERPGKSDLHDTEQRVGQYIWPDWMKRGWTETPLYPASALEQVRKDALEEAARLVDQFERPRMDYAEYTFIREAANAIRNLKDQANG